MKELIATLFDPTDKRALASLEVGGGTRQIDAPTLMAEKSPANPRANADGHSLTRQPMPKP